MERRTKKRRSELEKGEKGEAEGEYEIGEDEGKRGGRTREKEKKRE